MTKLLSIDADSKTPRGLKLGYRTAIMYLEPDDITCPHKSPECHPECLVYTGMMPMARKARDKRMYLFYNRRDVFNYKLFDEIRAFVKSTARKNLKPVVRLNGTSDIVWEAYRIWGKTLFEHFPMVQFYDYTPNAYRLTRKLPDNYYLTYSLKENNLDKAADVIRQGKHNVAVIFRKDIPDYWEGMPVIDGDEHDLRFLDPSGVIVGLRAKGKAKYNINGLVQD